MPPHLTADLQWPDRWSRQEAVELAGDYEAVPSGRSWTGKILAGWGLAGLADDVGLVASELLTNAVRATLAGGGASPVRLWLLGGQSCAVLLAWDAANDLPRRGDAGPCDERGRGLAIVDAIAARWGWYALPPQDASATSAGGKVVWALIGTLPFSRRRRSQ